MHGCERTPESINASRVCQGDNSDGPSYFEIQADDLQRAIEFHRKVIGWTLTRAEGLPTRYWRIETDGPRGGLHPRPAKALPAEQGTKAFVCSIEVPDFGAIAEKLADNGWMIALAKLAVPGLRSCVVGNVGGSNNPGKGSNWISASSRSGTARRQHVR